MSSSEWEKSNMVRCFECGKEYHEFETIDTGIAGRVCENCSSEFMLKHYSSLVGKIDEMEERDESIIRPITKQLKLIKSLLGNDHFLCTITKSQDGKWEKCPRTMVAMNILSWHPRPFSAITQLLRGDTIMLKDIWIKRNDQPKPKDVK